MRCVQCDTQLVAPVRSEYWSSKHACHIWLCPKCCACFDSRLASSRHRHGVSEGYPDRGPVTVSVVAGHIRSGLEKRHVKISTDRGRCGRVAGRNFARDGKNPRASARTAILPHPGINETTSRPTVADPYYRLSDPYYGYSDQLQGLFDFYAVPPFSPGYTYGHVRPGGWR